MIIFSNPPSKLAKTAFLAIFDNFKVNFLRSICETQPDFLHTSSFDDYL